MVLEILVCLYVMIATWVLFKNGSSKHVLMRSVGDAVRAAWEALIWPLVVWPWRELWSEWWQQLMEASSPRYQS